VCGSYLVILQDTERFSLFKHRQLSKQALSNLPLQ
jgi:hypothetical protein